jgi:hypothetical protein
MDENVIMKGASVGMTEQIIEQAGRTKTKEEMSREEDRPERVLGNLSCGFLSTLIEEEIDFEDVLTEVGTEVNGAVLTISEVSFNMPDSQHPGDLYLIFEKFFTPALEQIAKMVNYSEGQLVVRPYQDPAAIDFVAHGILSSIARQANLSLNVNQEYRQSVGTTEGYTILTIKILSGRVQL